MATYFLDRVDAAPLQNEDFSVPFNAWVANTVDSLNEIITNIQNALNGFDEGVIIPALTTAQITALAVNAPDGTIWYSTDHIPPVYVGKISGSLVQFTTTAFP